MYFNIITGKTSKFKYRFKTKEEFINQYGILKWRTSLTYRWVLNMDCFFGEDLETKHMNDIGYYKGYFISPDMVVCNNISDYKNIYLRKKTLVYE